MELSCWNLKLADVFFKSSSSFFRGRGGRFVVDVFASVGGVGVFYVVKDFLNRALICFRILLDDFVSCCLMCFCL